MGKLLFVEGVSGVGKSTMVRKLAERLRARGADVRCYLEFDATNPIDFYATAYLSREKYEAIRTEYHAEMNPIAAGEAVLIRYYDGDRPLFERKLLERLKQSEFCYQPARPVPFSAYTSAYETVWKNFSSASRAEYVIFDGTLLHHPLNDMMRNYHVSDAQAANHVSTLLGALGDTAWQLFYLYTQDIGAQLTRAHRDRKQNAPTDGEVAFWLERYEKDQYVLKHSVKKYQAYDVAKIGWDRALEQLLLSV